jgi:hypothetical protein
MSTSLYLVGLAGSDTIPDAGTEETVSTICNLSPTYYLPNSRLFDHGRPLSSLASAEQYLRLPDSSPWASRDSPDCWPPASRDCVFVPQHQCGLYREGDNTLLVAGRVRDDGTNILIALEVELCRAMSG